MPGIVHVNRRLTDVSMQFPPEFDSIGDWFFVRKGVENLSDQFVNVNKANMLAIRDLTPMGDDDVPPEITLIYDADTTFTCQIYAVASPDKWITSKNADPSLEWDAQRAIHLTLALRMRLEYIQVKSRLRSTAVMTNTSTLTAVQRFDAYSSSSSLPITTMQLICDNIGYENSGRKPNRIAMTTHVLRAICRSDEFKDLVKYQAIQNAAKIEQAENGQKALVEVLLGVAPGTIKIADHVWNSAAEGQTPVYKTFLGSDVVFGYVEPLGLRKWSLCCGFQWSAYDGSPTSIISIPQYQRGVVQGEEFRAFSVLDPKILQPKLGYLLKGCLDTTNTAYASLLD